MTDREPQYPQDCEAGCKHFTGGEVRHHKDCVFYSESLSRQLDESLAKIKRVRNVPVHTASDAEQEWGDSDNDPGWCRADQVREALT